MQVRDALAADEDALAALAGEPFDPGHLLRDREVRVAERDDEVVGFVAFDAWEDAVHVTWLAGSDAATARLLEEPIGFATHEGLSVEVVLVESDADLRDVVENAGFEDAGSGPRFEGEETRRYRRDVAGENPGEGATAEGSVGDGDATDESR